MGELIAAATVIPLRDTADGPEVLLLRKNSKVAFGGMWVFPGGRIDPEDVDPDFPDDEVAAARRGAVREAFEEADLLVEPQSLVPYSHWTPPEMGLHTPKRFATWFFACRAPVGEITIDMGEIHEDEWVRPVDMLRRRDEGSIQLAPPTIVTLHELAAHRDVDEVLRAAAARAPFRYATKVGTTEAGMVLMWAGDAGYDSGDADRSGPRHRIVMGDARCDYERTIDLH